MLCLCDITDCDEISQGFPLPYLHTGHWKWQRPEIYSLCDTTSLCITTVRYHYTCDSGQALAEAKLSNCGKEKVQILHAHITCIQLLMLYKKQL